MARRIAVEIVGDAVSLERAFARASSSASTFAATSIKASTTAAEARVAASAKQIQSLRADTETFAAASASYVKGSDEQIAASKLLIDTQHRLQVAMGETSLATGRAGGSARGAEREVGRFSRGALAGSGAVKGLGRSLAFASGGFLAFAGGFQVITKSVEAARSLAVTQRQLVTQIRASGEAWKNYTGLVNKATLALSLKSGFTNQELIQSLAQEVRSTGDVTQGLRLNAIAADVSRGAHISLLSAARALGKAWDGSTTSLKRLGIELPKGVTGLKAINIVAKQFAGQAKAGASAADRFNATWTDTEEIIGNALLPILNKYLGKFGEWLAKMDRTGRLQRDVNTAVHDGVAIFSAIAWVIKTVDRVTGSFVHTLELLATVKLASWAADAVLSLKGLIATEARAGATAVVAGAETEGAFAGIAAAASAALGPIAAVAAAIFGVYELGKAGGGYHAFGTHVSGHGTPAQIAYEKARLNGYQGSFAQFQRQHPSTSSSAEPSSRGADALRRADERRAAQERMRRARAAARAAAKAAGTSTSAKTATFQLPYRLQREQALAGLTQSNADDLKVARDVVAYVKKQLASGKLKPQQRLQALQIEQSALQTLWSAQAAASQKIASAAAKAKAKAQAAAAKAAAAAAKAAQFTVPTALQVADARALALGLPDAKILLKMKAAAEKALKSGRLNAQGQIDAWNEIASVNQQLGSSATSALGLFKQASTRLLTAGLGLTPAQRAALRARLSQLGPGRTVPGHGVGAYGYAIGSDGRPLVVHTHVNIDGKRVADNTTKHQQRRRRHNPSQRRGPNAGG